MIVMFHIGSTPLFQLGSQARQDSWIAVLIGAAGGAFVMAVFVALQRRKPEAGLVELLRLTVGRWPAVFFGLLYAAFFAYQSMRNVRDFGELTSLSLLQNSPKWIIMGIIVLIAWYTVMNGNEAFFRTTQLLFIIVLGSYFLMGMVVLAMGLPDTRMLRPVLEHGPLPVFRAALPDIFSFPFTQGVIFLVFWKYAANRQAVRRTAYWGYATGAVFIILMNALIVSVLGPLSTVSALPYLEVVQLVKVANFVERLDVVVTLLLFTGLYIKLTAFYFGAAIVIRELFSIPYAWGAAFIGVIIYASSFAERNNTVHLWIGFGVSLRVSLVMQVGIPVALLLLALVRIRGTERRRGGSTATEGKAG